MTTVEALVLLESTRRFLQEKRIDQARQRFLQLPDLEHTCGAHLEDVLRDFYTAGLYDIQVLLSFLESLPNWQWTLDGCVVLHRVDEVLRSQASGDAGQHPMLPLAFFLHKLMSHLEGPVRVRAESYWYEWVSPTIRAIVMGEELVMESLVRKEMMYAPINDFAYDGDRRNVFCWQPAWTPDGSKEKWRLIPANAQKDRFYIQNVQYQEYLYAADYAKFRRDDHGHARSRVFLWRKANEAPGESGHWQLVALDRHKRDLFALYNPYQKEYLYAPKDVYDHQRRHVLTTKARPQDPQWQEERQWRLAPATFSVMEQGIEAFFCANYPEAVEKLTQALNELPDNTEHVKCFAYRMTANLRMRHYERIEEDFHAIQELGGDKAAIFHGLAHLWEENAAFLATKAQDQSISDQNPFFMQHQLARGDHFFVRKDYQSAILFYQEAATAKGCSSLSTATSETKEDDPETRRKRAIAYISCGKCYFALEELEIAWQYLSIAQAIENLPLDIEASVLLWMGKCKRKQKLYDEALPILEKAFDRTSAVVASMSSSSMYASLKLSIVLEMRITHILKQNLYGALFSNCDGPIRISSEDQETAVDSERGTVTTAEKSLQQMMDLFHCPLSLELMDDPVMTPSGNTYEREMIEKHLEVNGNFDPLTRAPVTKAQLYPNRALKLLMETMLSDHRLGLMLASCSS